MRTGWQLIFSAVKFRPELGQCYQGNHGQSRNGAQDLSAFEEGLPVDSKLSWWRWR